MTRVRVAIIGAGFAGIGTALRLAAAGEDSFVLLERAAAVGGTWRDNTYPGVACDVPAHLYCFSFLPNPSFTRKFAPGAEIRAYLEHATGPVRDHLRLGTTVLRADWAGGRWRLDTSTGPVTAQVVVLAAGRLTAPRIPQVPGVFDGPVMHTSAWDEAVRLDGARVAVVGTGASGVQVIPHVARRARSVLVMQRSPSYVLPRDDTVYGPDQRAWFAAHPDRLAVLRADLYAQAEQLYDARVGDPTARHDARDRALDNLTGAISDPHLVARLTPDHEFGCKRVLFSNDYYPALTRSHVAVTGPLTGYEPHAVRTADGRHRVDVVILATGFHTARQPYATIVHGRDGRTLQQHWAGGMRAYASISVHGFPNLFILDGPNASLSHNSSLVMIETQIDYLLDALRHTGDGQAVEVTGDAEDRYAREIQARSTGKPWTSGCDNWYIDPATGRQVLLWPGRAAEYHHRYSQFTPHAYTTT